MRPLVKWRFHPSGSRRVCIRYGKRAPSGAMIKYHVKRERMKHCNLQMRLAIRFSLMGMR